MSSAAKFVTTSLAAAILVGMYAVGSVATSTPAGIAAACAVTGIASLSRLVVGSQGSQRP
jgi:hypothetical protein